VAVRINGQSCTSAVGASVPTSAFGQACSILSRYVSWRWCHVGLVEGSGMAIWLRTGMEIPARPGYPFHDWIEGILAGLEPNCI
jgi:hypothetical protein